MKILIEKGKRRLTLLDDQGAALCVCPVALGFAPEGPKEQAGDGKTPEGAYFVCLKKMGKYGPSLGVSYPNADDARRMHADDALIQCIRKRTALGQRPPWGTALGGEIYIHGGGTATDWTAGCIALSDADAQALLDAVPLGTEIEILP